MAQRITNSMMIDTFNRNLYKNNEIMQRYQNQLAANRKIVRISDDPVGVVKSLSARSRLSSIEQYKKNLQDAQGWLTQTESAVSELNEIIKRVYELTVNITSEVKTPDDRKAVANEIKELMDQVVTLGNATMGDKYIFGGYNVTKGPIEIDAATGQMTFNGKSLVDPADRADVLAMDNIISFEIGYGTDLPVSFSGPTVMGLGDSNIYYQMKKLYDDAISDTMKDLQPYIGVMQELQKNVLAISAEIGGRQNRLDLMSARFEQDYLNYTQMKSDVEDLDQAETIMYFSFAEAVYRQALSVGGRILQPTLMDFLR